MARQRDILAPSRRAGVDLAMGPPVRDDVAMTTAGSRVDWLLFVVLGFLWGCCYMFI